MKGLPKHHEKPQVIERLHRHGYQNKVIDRALGKILAIERDSALRELAQLEARLQEFEVQHQRCPRMSFIGASSRVNWENSADFFEWNAFCDMANALRARWKHLETEMA